MGQVRSAAPALCLLAALTAFSSGQAPDPSLEYQVKAAYLLNFAKFMDWPSGAFAGADSPIAVCILGTDPFGRALDEIVQGETIDSRRLIVRRLSQAPAPGVCQILFIGGQEGNVPGILSSPRPGTLTAGEGERFLAEGGMIAFVIDNHRVRFDINQTAVAVGGVRLSSKLFRAARLVRK